METRALLAAPVLIDVESGTGKAIAEDSVISFSPDELVLSFDSSPDLDPATVSATTVFLESPGADGAFDGNDVLVPVTFVGVGAGPNEVLLQFGQSLRSDLYRITIQGAVANTDAEPFNGGVDDTFGFEVDLPTPALIAVKPNQGEFINLDPTQPTTELSVAPREFTLQFQPGDVLDPATINVSTIQVERAGHDDDFDNGSIRVPIGWVGIGDSPEEVIVRFAENLPDDLYRITLDGDGTDLDGMTITPITTGLGEVLGDGTDTTVEFSLELGARVVAVVPQPITRNAGGALVQRRDQIVLYLNEDDIDPASVVTREFYQLIFTNDTLDPTDDVVNLPKASGGIVYDDVNNTITLTFDSAIHLLSGAGTYRLRVGVFDAPVSSLVTVASAGDDNSSFTTAQNLGTLTTDTLSINAAIEPQGVLNFPALPGGADEPGHREIAPESHIGGADTTPGVPTISYYFPDEYGVVLGAPVFNQITDVQKERAREVFELYSEIGGVQFVELSSTIVGAGNIAVITGDPRAINPAIPQGAASLAGALQGSGATAAIMNGVTNYGESEYGGGWFGTAMHEIGHTLGLGHDYDLPSIMGAGLTGFSGNPVEPVFPGNHDITHFQRLFRPDSTDIDMYSFTLTEAGRFSAEVIAERGATASHLDSVLRLYDSSGVLIAQNDDYFSSDPFIGVELEAGVYYVGVSSAGNTDYDPVVSDTGANGRTQGNYELRVDFDRTQTTVLVDAAGTPLDGDSDGMAGGVFEFWLTPNSTANTIYVDKANAADPAQTGSLAHPYSQIDTALASVTAATQAIRIVGNGGTDGDILTGEDNLPYLIGRNDANAVLEDGADIKVPKGVTVMVDAGALFKMQTTHVDVGSSAQGIDRSQGAFQTLGTPLNNVILTAYGNDALGGDSDGVTDGANPGDYAGIVFRDDSDREDAGIFLNHIQQTDITFGGGQTGSGAVYAPIRTETARPTIMYNRITQNSFAAISADPNSFEDTLNRIGPDIQFNFIDDNTINGLLIRTNVGLGQESLEQLDVPARLDDHDITHVLTDNLLISGTAGGFLDGAARLNGRLQIDPGVILKVERSRIETTRGDSQFIAEGTPERQIIFTSLRDDRYGAGGTFDSSSDGAGTTPGPGDWGGLVFNAASSASIDNVYLAHAGGRIPIEGDFDQFNAIEIHQADVRVANSRIERNAIGQSNTNRNGRGFNDATTVFVRGAQPIIVNNDFRDNLGSVISINVNSLDSKRRGDYGTTTGESNSFASLVANYGPLIRLNTFRNNALNGLDLRGEELTSEVIVDDFDIVHVLQDEIYIDNHHTFSGMRLLSSQDGSLVFKLAGANAGITANGKGIDIDDRIGGTLQIVGNGQFPVIFTSLFDDSIGAGFGPDGLPVRDTNNDGGATTAGPGDWRSLALREFANDRNVRIVQEHERVLTEGKEENGVPVNAQVLGVLAPGEKLGDNTRALGFEIFGSIGLDNPADVDIYEFEVNTGTEIWIDLDRTGSSLNAILELIQLDGTVLASAGILGDGVLAGSAMQMQKQAFLGIDYYTVNPRDEGFRVILPVDPQVGVKQETFYVRVRSLGAQTSGEYELEIRLRQRDEKSGSTIQYADVSYATNGIEVIGLPRHSPLLGEAAEAGDASNGFAGAQTIGDLLASDRQTLSVAGNVAASNDVDWYRFDLGYEYIQAIPGLNDGSKSFSTIFDIDYADGLTRGDLTLSVFDTNGNLIFVGRDSDITDDQPGAGQGQDIDDLTRGSFGTLDPFIGPVQIPAATPGQDLTYFVAVSSNAQLPGLLNQTYTLNSQNPLVRLEPIDSIDRIIEDHIGFTGYTSGSSLLGVTNSIQANQGGLFDTTSLFALNTHVAEFTLGDVVLYVSQGNRLYTIDAATGATRTNIGPLAGGNSPTAGIEFREDGRLFGYHDVPNTGNTVGNIVEINPGTAAVTTLGNDSIPDDAAAMPRNFEQVTSNDAHAMAWRTGVVDSDDNADDFILYIAVPDSVDPTNSVLYRADPTNGSAVVVMGQPWGRVGFGGQTITGSGVVGETTGMVFSGNTLYGVNENGQFYRISTATSQATLVRNFGPLGYRFTDITIGPQNLQSGSLAQTFFAVTDDGRLVAFDTAGNLQRVFDGANSVQQLSVTGAAAPADTFTLTFLGQTTDPISYDAPREVSRNEQQRIDISGAPTGGSFNLTFTNPFGGTDSFVNLNGGINAATTTVNVDNAALLPRLFPYTITIDNEDLLVTAITGNALTVQRGANGTTPAPHGNGSNVFIAATQTTLPIPADARANAGVNEQQQIGFDDPGTGAVEPAATAGTFRLNFADGQGNNGTTVDIPFDATANATVDQVQQLTINGNPTPASTFRLAFNGVQTANISSTATANDIRIALEALSNVNPGDVVVIAVGVDNFSQSDMLVTFTGQFSGIAQPLLVTNNAGMVGGTVANTGIITPAHLSIQTALEHLSFINPGDVIVTGGPINTGAVTVEFSGRYAELDVPDLVVTNEAFDMGALFVSGGFRTSSLSVQRALELLLNVQVGDVQASGGALPGVPVTVEFTGNFGAVDVPQMTADEALLIPVPPATDVTITTTVNASLSIRDALEALPNLGPNDFVLTGGALPGNPVTITFGGAYTDQALPPMIVTNTASNTGSAVAAITLLASAGNFEVQTSLGSLTGLAFSPLDFNLWHVTENRRDDAGHGINPTSTSNRVNPATFPVLLQDGGGTRTSNEGAGGASFWFGLEEWTNQPDNDRVYFDYGTGAQAGVTSARHQQLTAHPNIGNNYNLPGGASGVLETSTFNLSGYSRTDKPTLYFNYFLETENSAGTNTVNTFRDAARVYLVDGAGNHFLVATNNSALSSPADPTAGELPTHITASGSALNAQRVNQKVQELFDNSNSWRQARVDLADFAGMTNLRLRFEFSTSGSSGDGLSGDVFGNQNSPQKHQNNEFEGFYIDDILLGLTERGEQVTGANRNATNFFQTPQNPVFGDPVENLTGRYQLEIREGAEYIVDGTGVVGNPISALLPDIVVAQTFDTNDRFILDPTQARSQAALGDQNVHRDQGHVLIENNSVHFASDTGILIDAAPRDADGLSSPGAPRNFDTLNNPRLTSGVTVKNNIVDNFGTTGIRFSGDNAAGGLAAVPFGKLVNNTVYGGETPSGVGFLIDHNASPTLLNNIVANTVTGISIDASSSSTVVGTTLFQGNGANGTLGTDAIRLAAGEPLFVDALSRNFYLASGSLAIDSSLNNLVDRPAFTAVKAPLGIPASDVLAPDTDRFGQVRLDDPNQDPPPGLGQNIFKDRGAVERADFIGPSAILLDPEDNGIGDNDPQDHEVDFIVDDFLTQFVVQLLDAGIGIADSLINAGQFALYQDQNPLTDPMAVPLVEGQDYHLIYNPVADQVIFQAVTVFATEHRYFITLDRDMTTGIRDLAGNILQSNRPAGGTNFGISLTDGINDPPINIVPGDQIVMEDTDLVFSDANGTQIAVSDSDVHLGNNELTVTLTATNGWITLNGAVGNVTPIPGLTFTTGDGWRDITMTFTGTVPIINASLEGMIFRGDQDYFGPASVRIFTEDNGQFSGTPVSPNMSDDDTVLIDVTPVNDAPTFDPLVDPAAVNEDAGPRIINGFVSNVSAGPANEVAAGQTVSFDVTVVSTTGGFAAADFFTLTGAPAINSAGRLTFTTNQDVNGTATIRVVAIDSDGAMSVEDSFVLTVNALNDAPVFVLNNAAFSNPPTNTIIAGQEDSGAVIVDLIDTFDAARATALDELGSQMLTWVLGSPSFTGSLNFDTFSIDADGNLTYVPTPDTSGTAIFTVALRDDGATGGGNVNVSAPRALTINIVGTPDPPVPATPDYVIDEGDTLLLDASGTFDPDVVHPGDTLTYEWDLNNDGNFTDVSSISTTAQTISVPYSVLTGLGLTEPSINPIALRVTDTFSGTSVTVNATLSILIVDYGDAPNTYGTTKASNGAAHTIVSNVFLGSAIDNETSGVPGSSATGDDTNAAIDDEDGVVVDPLIQRSATLSVPSFVNVTASVAGKVDVWLDLNGDGVFDHATEHVNGGTSFDVGAGSNRLDFMIPAGTFGSSSVQNTYLRVRYSTAGGLTPTGRADDGEVEDYRVSINPLQAASRPTVIRPAGPETSDLTPTIGWNDLPENYFYDVVLRNAAGTPTVLATRTQATSVVVPSTLANGTYTVEVTPYNKVDQAGPTSLAYSFTVRKLVVASPTGDTADNTPTVSWNQIIGTQNYQLVINSISSGISSLVSELSLPGNSTTFTVANALDLGRYEVLVRAIDAAGDPGDWSDALAFTVRTPPIIVGPTGVTTNNLPLLQWSPVPGAQSYNIVLDNVTDNVTSVLTQTGLTATSFQITQPLPMGRYSFRVEGISAPDVVSGGRTTSFPSASGVVFTVAPAPVPLTPTGNLNDSTPTIAWQAVPGADEYEVTVRRDFGNNAVVAGPVTVNTTQYTVASALPLGRYSYQIRSINRQAIGGSGGDVTSAPAAATVFSITTAPVVQMPNTSIYDTTPTIAWLAPEGSVVHEVWVNNDTTQTRVFYAPSATGTSIDTTVLPPGNYRVWVRSFADTARTIASDWSAGRPFRIGTPPQNLQPTGRNTDSTPTLTWEGSLGGENYELWLSSISSHGRILLATAIDSAAYTVPDELPVGKYRFWVRATSGFGEQSAWSQARDFEVVAPPVLQSFGPSTFDTTPTFNWNNVTRTLNGITTTVQRYEVYLDNLTNGQVNVLRNVPTTSTSFTVPNPLSAGTYLFWVRAVVTGTNASAGTTTTAWSVGYRFDVGGRPVVDAVASTANRRPEFTWQPVGGAASYEIFVARSATPDIPVVRQAGLTTTSFVPTQNLTPDDYSVWVRATNASGQLSPWSRPRAFRILALVAPVMNPIGSTTDRTPTFTWSAVPGASRYEIFIARAATPDTALIRQGNLVPTTFTPVSNLSLGNYRAWVRAVSATGETGAWSRFIDFTVVSSDIPDDFEGIDGSSATYVVTGLPNAAEQSFDVAISMLPARVVDRAVQEISDEPVPVSPPQVSAQEPDIPALPEADSDVFAVLMEEEAAEETDLLMSEWDAEIWAEESAQPASANRNLAAASAGAIAAASVFRTDRSRKHRQK